MIEQVPSLSLLAMVMLGLLGSGHCVGMCGGIATGLGFATSGNKLPLVIGYNSGRITSYAVAGILVAAVGYWGRSYLALGPWLRILAGVILVLMGLYLANWSRALVWLEKGGARLWRKIQPLGNRLLPVEHMGHAFALGLVWGWLPCGLVYSALAYAATAETPLLGGAAMVAFGLGTAPAMIVGGVFSSTLKAFLQHKAVRLVMALLMIGFGVWTLYSSVAHLSHMGGSASPPSGTMEHHHHGS